MKKVAFCIVILAFSLSMKAQNTRTGVRSADPLTRLEQKEMKGKVILQFDSLIIENYHKHLDQNSKNRGIRGYRIRIFSDNGMGAKDGQKQVKARFLSSYPQINTYDRYEGSYYKIYVGDFRTKRDALKVLGTIKHDFPDAFIVDDNIIIEE